MIKAFLVIKEGIYVQEIFGVFETEENAIITAKELATNEIDDHHTFVVLEIAFNCTGKIEVTTCGQGCDNKEVFTIRKDGRGHD